MILYDAGGIESQILTSILKIKGIQYTTEYVNSECAIADNEIVIDDIYAAIKYLDERHPKPQLFSDKPEQNARLNLFLLKILRGERLELDLLSHLLSDHEYVMGDTLSIADIALLHAVVNYTAWQPYKERIETQINK